MSWYSDNIADRLVLHEQGLVDTRRESQTIYYRLADSPAMNVIGLLHEIYCEN